MSLEALYDLADEVRESYIPTPDEDVPYVGLEHISQQTLQLLGRGSSLEVESNKYKFKKGDILFGTLRPYFRKIIIAPFDGVCSTEYSVIRPKDSSKANFVFYFLANEKFIEYATTNSVGARPRTKWKLFSDYKVRKTTDQEKTDIGIKLRCLDDLIENNRRRIQLLEESARLLYQEWFVHLRFPGHEQVKIIDGVPEGWEESTLGSLASVQSGYAFKSKDWLDAGNPVIKIKNITGDGTVDIADCQCVDDNVAEKAQKFKLEEGDFLIAMTGATVGKVGIMPRSNQTYYLNQRVGKFEFVGETSREFVFCLANTKHFRNQIENLAGGAAQPNISGKQIESIKVLRPSDKLLSFFSEQTHNLFEQRQLLVESNKKLAQARDLLLPKLMSGELTV